MEVEVKLRLADAGAHAKLAAALQPGYKATYQQVGAPAGAAWVHAWCCSGGRVGAAWVPCVGVAWGGGSGGVAVNRLPSHPVNLTSPPPPRQENFFFDGAAQELTSNRVVLRVRFYNRDAKAVITVKASGRMEWRQRTERAQGGRQHACAGCSECAAAGSHSCPAPPPGSPSCRPPASLPRPPRRLQGKQVLKDGIGRAPEEEEGVDPALARQFLQVGVGAPPVCPWPWLAQLRCARLQGCGDGASSPAQRLPRRSHAVPAATPHPTCAPARRRTQASFSAWAPL